MIELTTGTTATFTDSYRIKDASVMVIFDTKPDAGHYVITYEPIR